MSDNEGAFLEMVVIGASGPSFVRVPPGWIDTSSVDWDRMPFSFEHETPQEQSE